MKRRPADPRYSQGASAAPLASSEYAGPRPPRAAHEPGKEEEDSETVLSQLSSAHDERDQHANREREEDREPSKEDFAAISAEIRGDAAVDPLGKRGPGDEQGACDQEHEHEHPAYAREEAARWRNPSGELFGTDGPQSRLSDLRASPRVGRMKWQPNGLVEPRFVFKAVLVCLP